MTGRLKTCGSRTSVSPLTSLVPAWKFIPLVSMGQSLLGTKLKFWVSLADRLIVWRTKKQCRLYCKWQTYYADLLISGTVLCLMITLVLLILLLLFKIALFLSSHRLERPHVFNILIKNGVHEEWLISHLYEIPNYPLFCAAWHFRLIIVRYNIFQAFWPSSTLTHVGKHWPSFFPDLALSPDWLFQSQTRRSQLTK